MPESAPDSIPDPEVVARLKQRYGDPHQLPSTITPAAIMRQISNTILKASTSALGLPLGEHEGAALQDEDASVPSAAAADAAVEEGDLTSEGAAGTGSKRGLGVLRAVVNATRFVSGITEQRAAANKNAGLVKGEIAQLLEQHGAAVQAMHELLLSNPLYVAKEHDALWRLRFLLSAKSDVHKATDAAAACIKWRADNDMETVAAKLRTTPWDQWPGYAQVQQYTPYHVTHPDPGRGTVMYQRLAEFDFDGLLGTEKNPKISDEEWLQYQLHFKEWLFIRRDTVSRRTGSLAKNIVVVDMAGLSRKHISHSRFKKLMTHQKIKVADEMYPQALGTIVILGLPSALSWIFNNVVKPLAPPKVQDKIRVASNAGKEYARLGIDLAHVPHSLGGMQEGWPPRPDARLTPP